MVEKPVYLLDTDIFISAARSYYAFDVAPGFWQALIEQARNGRVLSIDRVKDEIMRGKDELAKWAKDKFKNWFVSTGDRQVISSYRQIMAWVVDQRQYFDPAKEEFANNADGWLVAYAAAYRCTVTTNEKFEPNIQRRVKIPNVCREFNVPYVDTFEMLRALGIRLG